jgi:hypothetical protein
VAVKFPFIRPCIDTCPVDVVVFVFAKEVRTVDEFEISLSIFLTLEELSFVIGSIWPDFGTYTMLLVEHPITFVFSAVVVEILTPAVSHIIEPESIIHAPVIVDEAAFAVGLVFAPVTLIF